MSCVDSYVFRVPFVYRHNRVVVAKQSRRKFNRPIIHHRLIAELPSKLPSTTYHTASFCQQDDERGLCFPCLLADDIFRAV